MSSYISSSNNRFYVAPEAGYGQAAAIAGKHRIPAVKLKARQEAEKVNRRDKTGSRTWAGMPPGLRKRTTFGLTSYMTAWSDDSQQPSHGPLISSAMGATAQIFSGGTIAGENGTLINFTQPHGLAVGQAVAIDGELRFVTNVQDPASVRVNAPFTLNVTAGSLASPTATYRLATDLPSASIFDYWSPDSAVHRIIAGSAVDQFTLTVNGDFHQFEFSGVAADLVDSASFETGQAGLEQFPEEPASVGFDYTIVPGNLGQAWLGSSPDQFFTLTTAKIRLLNNVDLRAREFGSETPRCILAGVRQVTADVSLFANDDDQTKALYQAARQKSPISMMLQLGHQSKQLFGVYLRSVVPEVPEFDDSESRLQWNFQANRAQGTTDDEIIVAFA